jgi:hypothetical protein
LIEKKRKLDDEEEYTSCDCRWSCSRNTRSGSSLVATLDGEDDEDDDDDDDEDDDDDVEDEDEGEDGEENGMERAGSAYSWSSM